MTNTPPAQSLVSSRATRSASFLQTSNNGRPQSANRVDASRYSLANFVASIGGPTNMGTVRSESWVVSVIAAVFDIRKMCMRDLSTPFLSYFRKVLHQKYGVVTLVDQCLLDLHATALMHLSTSCEIALVHKFFADVYDMRCFAFYVHARSVCLASLQLPDLSGYPMVQGSVVRTIGLRLFSVPISSRKVSSYDKRGTTELYLKRLWLHMQVDDPRLLESSLSAVSCVPVLLLIEIALEFVADMLSVVADIDNERFLSACIQSLHVDKSGGQTVRPRNGDTANGSVSPARSSVKFAQNLLGIHPTSSESSFASGLPPFRSPNDVSPRCSSVLTVDRLIDTRRFVSTSTDDLKWGRDGGSQTNPATVRPVIQSCDVSLNANVITAEVGSYIVPETNSRCLSTSVEMVDKSESSIITLVNRDVGTDAAASVDATMETDHVVVRPISSSSDSSTHMSIAYKDIGVGCYACNSSVSVLAVVSTSEAAVMSTAPVSDMSVECKMSDDVLLVDSCVQTAGPTVVLDACVETSACNGTDATAETDRTALSHALSNTESVNQCDASIGSSAVAFLDASVGSAAVVFVDASVHHDVSTCEAGHDPIDVLLGHVDVSVGTEINGNNLTCCVPSIVQIAAETNEVSCQASDVLPADVACSSAPAVIEDGVSLTISECADSSAIALSSHSLSNQVPRHDPDMKYSEVSTQVDPLHELDPSPPSYSSVLASVCQDLLNSEQFQQCFELSCQPLRTSARRLDVLSLRTSSLLDSAASAFRRLHQRFTLERDAYAATVNNLMQEMQLQRDRYENELKDCARVLEDFKEVSQTEIDRIAARLIELNVRLGQADRVKETLETQLKAHRPGGEQFTQYMEVELRRQKLRSAHVSDIRRVAGLRMTGVSVNVAAGSTHVSGTKEEDLNLFFVFAEVGSEYKSFSYRSEIVKATLDPRWKEIQISQVSEGMNRASSFLFRVFDSKRHVPRRECLVTEQWINIASMQVYEPDKDPFAAASKATPGQIAGDVTGGYPRHNLILFTIGNLIYYCPLLSSSQ